ncbi:MAG: right-handed parallel beta-helix repeat-containing protein, partial [Candidatus Heimdallarchaeota archaeon]
MRGKANSINFQDKISTNVVTTLKIINAPGTEISNLDLENINIELINSPNSKIVNNRIHNLYFDSDLSAISILNSSYTIIMDNTIEENKISDGKMIGIKVNNSAGVEIRNNIIDDLISETVINPSTLSLGIVISNSTFTNVTENQITNIYGGSTSAIVVERGKNNKIAFNNISEITTYSVDRSESFGILLVNTSDNIIEFNKLRNIFSNNFKARSLAFGISLATVNTTLVNSNNISTVEAVADRPDSFGIHVSSSVQISVLANNIDNIYTKSDIENRAFSTGIYMSHSQILEIKLNKIKNIITEGRASYGVYVDDSNLLEISENVIYRLKSVFRYQNNAEAIIIRKVNNTFISKNFISEITSLANNIDNNLQIPVAIGVLLDNIINSTIENNILNDISSTGNAIPTDSIGILIASNQNVNVKFNTLTQIYSDGFNSFSIGIISQGSSKLNINSNAIDKINSGSNSILLYQAFSVNILVNNNSLYIIGDSDRIFGIYSIKNRNETIQNNNIIANHQTVGISAISLSFNDNFKIYNNKLNDLVNN